MLCCTNFCHASKCAAVVLLRSAHWKASTECAKSCTVPTPCNIHAVYTSKPVDPLQGLAQTVSASRGAKSTDAESSAHLVPRPRCAHIMGFLLCCIT